MWSSKPNCCSPPACWRWWSGRWSSASIGYNVPTGLWPSLQEASQKDRGGTLGQAWAGSPSWTRRNPKNEFDRMTIDEKTVDLLDVPWCGSLSLCRRSPRWSKAGPPGWSGCCWARARRSRPRGCWACGWWPLTPTSSAAPAAPSDLRDELIVFKRVQRVNYSYDKMLIGFTIEKKICQARWRATVYVCWGDAICSGAVMQLWNSTTDTSLWSHHIQTLTTPCSHLSGVFQCLSLKPAPASAHLCCCSAACTTSAWPSLSARFPECWCRPCASLLLRTEIHPCPSNCDATGREIYPRSTDRF